MTGVRSHTSRSFRATGCGLLIATSTVVAIGCSQSYKEAVVVICQTPRHSCNRLTCDEADKSRAMSLWLGDRLRNERADGLLDALSQLPPQRRADVLRGVTIDLGIAEADCPMIAFYLDWANSYRNPRDQTYEEGILAICRAPMRSCADLDHCSSDDRVRGVVRQLEEKLENEEAIEFLEGLMALAPRERRESLRKVVRRIGLQDAECQMLFQGPWPEGFRAKATNNGGQKEAPSRAGKSNP